MCLLHFTRCLTRHALIYIYTCCYDDTQGDFKHIKINLFDNTHISYPFLTKQYLRLNLINLMPQMNYDFKHFNFIIAIVKFHYNYIPF